MLTPSCWEAGRRTACRATKVPHPWGFHTTGGVADTGTDLGSNPSPNARAVAAAPPARPGTAFSHRLTLTRSASGASTRGSWMKWMLSEVVNVVAVTWTRRDDARAVLFPGPKRLATGAWCVLSGASRAIAVLTFGSRGDGAPFSKIRSDGRIRRAPCGIVWLPMVCSYLSNYVSPLATPRWKSRFRPLGPLLMQHLLGR
jgi:hypothetical protein